MFEKIWINYQNKKQREENELNRIAIEKRTMELDKIKKNIQEETEKMFSKDCRQFGFDGKCFKNCVHFQAGYIVEFDGCLIEREPKCRLWK